jgi:hypothetical protein
MLAFLGLRWMQQMIIRGFHQHCKAAEFIGCRKTILIPRIQLYPSDPTILFQVCRRRLSNKILFPLTINKAQGLNCFAVYPPSPGFPMASSMWHFPDLTSLLQLLKDIDNECKVTDWWNRWLYVENWFILLFICANYSHR